MVNNPDVSPSLEVRKKVGGKFEKVSIDQKGREIKKPGIEEAVTIEEVFPEVEDEQIEQIGLQGVEILKKEDLPRLPKTDDEKKVWAEWNKKLEAATEYFHEEAPTQKEINIEEVPTVKESAYGEQKVQAAPELGEDTGWLDANIDVVEEIPAYTEFVDGKWVTKERQVKQAPSEITETQAGMKPYFKPQVELPIWMQEGHENEGDPKDQQSLEEVLRQEFARQKGAKAELPAPNVPKAEFDDWEPPRIEDLKEEALLATEEQKAYTQEQKNISPEDKKEFDSLVAEATPKIDRVTETQFDVRKSDYKEREDKVSDEIINVAKISDEIGYKGPEDLKNVPGMEKFVGKMANILDTAKFYTEKSLSRMAGSVMAAKSEIGNFFRESKLKGKYKKELRGIEREIKMTKDEEKLGRLNELRNIITAALM